MFAAKLAFLSSVRPGGGGAGRHTATAVAPGARGRPHICCGAGPRNPLGTAAAQDGPKRQARAHKSVTSRRRGARAAALAVPCGHSSWITLRAGLTSGGPGEEVGGPARGGPRRHPRGRRARPARHHGPTSDGRSRFTSCGGATARRR